MAVDIVGIGGHGDNLLYNLLFGSQVPSLLLLYFGAFGRFFILDDIHQGFELLFTWVFLRHVSLGGSAISDKLLASGTLCGIVHGVKLLLQPGGVFRHDFIGRLGSQSLKRINNVGDSG